jgi:hypothetical protein
MAEQGLLDEAEVNTFTDNVWCLKELIIRAIGSRKLNQIILCLRKVEQSTGCILHVIHIAGTRMKASGVDGLSRGDMLERMLKVGADPMQ